jgi:hypothetical protein
MKLVRLTPFLRLRMRGFEFRLPFPHVYSNDTYFVNREIDLDFTLNAATSTGWGGFFDIDARTTNKPLTLTVLESPADSMLRIVGVTTNAQLWAHLHPAFEGHFRATTTNARAGFNQGRTHNDPKGQGRERKIDYIRGKEDGTGFTGYVHWGRGTNNSGSAVFQTTNAFVGLHLG